MEHREAAAQKGTKPSTGRKPLPFRLLKMVDGATGRLTTCSLTWMQKDFFFTAAIPVVNVFRMLVALRRANWEPPSRPAMDPDNTMAVPVRPAKRLLIIFLREGERRRITTLLAADSPSQRLSRRSSRLHCWDWVNGERHVPSLAAGGGARSEWHLLAIWPARRGSSS